MGPHGDARPEGRASGGLGAGTGRHPGRGAAVVGVPAGPRARPAAGPRREVAPQRRRSVRPRRAGSEGDGARPRGRPADPHPPRHVRPDRPAADARGGRGLPAATTPPDAYERLVDRLLASPHYGERWGRHWLDVVRYADTSGCNGDFPVPEAYRYRNYVIDSFNRDKPYDQFLREQIAGDLLPAASEEQRYEQVIATGYLAISRRFSSVAEEFHLTLDDTVDNLGKAVLGLSISCARCHDHKFDPIPQARLLRPLRHLPEHAATPSPGPRSTDIRRTWCRWSPPSGWSASCARTWTEMAELDRGDLPHLLAGGDARHRQGEGPTQGPGEGAPGRSATSWSSRCRPSTRPMPPPRGRRPTPGSRSRATRRSSAPRSPRGFLQVLGGQTLPPDEAGSGRLPAGRAG